MNLSCRSVLRAGRILKRVFTLPAKIIISGQLIGMSTQIITAILLGIAAIPMKLEYNVIPMLIGQIVVLMGLVVLRFDR